MLWISLFGCLIPSPYGAQMIQIQLKMGIHMYLQGDKDKKIEELAMELQRQEQLCAAYREKLVSFMNNMEEQTEELSSKIQVVVDNVRKIESEVQKVSGHR